MYQTAAKKWLGGFDINLKVGDSLGIWGGNGCVAIQTCIQANVDPDLAVL